MKRVVKLIGKNYDVILEEGKRVVTITPFSKDGKQDGGATRSWWKLEEVIEEYKDYGFIEA